MDELEVLPSNPLDMKLLAMADQSPEEISRRLNGVIRPRAVAARLVALTDMPDWLTAQRQDRVLTLRMQAILDQLEARGFDNDNAKTRLAVLKELGNRLDKRAAATNADLNTLYDNQGRIMAQAYDIALSYMKGALRDEIDPDRWDELSAEALKHAQTELTKHEAIEK